MYRLKWFSIERKSLKTFFHVFQVDALKRVPHIDRISITMPNKHYFNVNLAKFPKVGSKTNNEVFLPVDKPSGLISATVARKQLRSKL